MFNFLKFPHRDVYRVTRRAARRTAHPHQENGFRNRANLIFNILILEFAVPFLPLHRIRLRTMTIAVLHVHSVHRRRAKETNS